MDGIVWMVLQLMRMSISSCLVHSSIDVLNIRHQLDTYLDIVDETPSYSAWEESEWVMFLLGQLHHATNSPRRYSRLDMSI